MTHSTYNLDECLRCTHCAHLLVEYETLRSRQAILSQKISSTFTIATGCGSLRDHCPSP